MMKRQIIFRLDDICPRMHHSKFNRMVDIFQKHSVKPILGVVPDCKDEFLNCDEEDSQFWERMREFQNMGWTIAMHGTFHVYVTKNNGLISNGHKSEFAGLSYQEQYDKLEYGLRKLESQGIYTDVFMAPSHSYDQNTLRALKTLGFRYVTDGLSSRPYKHMDLVFVPCIDPKITKAKRLSTVCYHTNQSIEARYDETSKLLVESREQVISFADAALLPLMPYRIAKIEEKVRFYYKYKLVGKLWQLCAKVKAVFYK